MGTVMIYQRYIKELMRDREIAKANLDEAVDNANDRQIELHGKDMIILQELINAIARWEVRLGLQ